MLNRLNVRNHYVGVSANRLHTCGFNRIPMVVAFILIYAASPALAGVRFIANVFPDPDPNRTDQISGLTFDGGPNPLIIDGTSWRLSRLDAESGAVLESTIPSQAPSGTNRSLVFDSASDTYFTVPGQGLTQIDLTEDTVSGLPGGGWLHFNFLSMAINPVDGRLWLATDKDGGELWKINKTTGAASLHRSFGVFSTGGGGINALAIGPTGNFYVTGGLQGQAKNNLYQIDPDTGAVDFITSVRTSGISGTMRDFDYSPTTGRWYGIMVHGISEPRDYRFIEITGIPEPASAGIFICHAGVLLMQRMRRRY